MVSHEDNGARWVDERLTTLTPGDFQPDGVRARAWLEDRKVLMRRRARGLWLATATACLTLLVLPWPRAVAQQVWERLVLGRVEVLRVDDEHLPKSVIAALTLEPQQIEQHAVVGLAEAERLAGFQAALPPEGLFDGPPEFSVVKTVTLATKPLKTADLERALAAAGASDIPVPGTWEGMRVFAEAGPVLVTRYKGVEIMQSAPFRLTMPAGIEFGRFMEVAFRAFGRSASEAKALGEKLEANPALVMHFPEREPVRDVSLRSGQGIIVGNPDGPDGICFFWNTPDRIFIVSAENMSEKKAVVLANSMQ